MRVGIYSFYFDTYGGGERYILTLADLLLRRGDDVTIFSGDKLGHEEIKDRFRLDLTGASFDADAFGEGSNLLKRLMATYGYDLFIFLSNGSLPVSLARRNIVHFQTPLRLSNQKTLLNKIKLSRIKDVVCNSNYTKKYIDQTYGVNSRVIYPPVDVESIRPGKKANTILSVGRFFAEPHNKKQEILIQTFGEMVKKGLKGWQLVLFGGVAEDKREQAEGLRQKAEGIPVKIVLESSFRDLAKAYASAKVYWHAAGFGEDLDVFPDRAEHFGITTVEAMSAGAVPVVFNGGGQKEIVEDGKNGFFWSDQAELTKKTKLLISDSGLLTKLSKQAQIRARDFSQKRFLENWSELLNG